MPKPVFRPGSDEEWAALLHQLRQQPPARPQPFFYTRVQARLAAKAPVAGASWLGWVRRPAYVALLGLLGLAMSGDGVVPAPAAAPRPTSPAARLLAQ
jgi:hypothetical protein